MTAALGYQTLRSSPTLPTASFSATAPSLGEPREPLGEADGAVPDGVTVFDDAIPAVAKLDPDAEYGSEDEADRWVATATTSPHVAGDAVDIGRSDATEWLSRHGAEHGLCQIYRNEPWHYELRTEAIEHGCPRMYADPTQDPRMQQ